MAWKWLYDVQIGDAEPVTIGTSLAEAKNWAKSRGATKIVYEWKTEEAARRLEQAFPENPLDVNREGLTFREWLRAVNAYRGRGRALVDEPKTRRAWRDGEDPTEYGAYARENPALDPEDYLRIGVGVVLVGAIGWLLWDKWQSDQLAQQIAQISQTNTSPTPAATP